MSSVNFIRLGVILPITLFAIGEIFESDLLLGIACIFPIIAMKLDK